MTVKEAAEVIGCSASHVGTLIRLGKLLARRVSGPTRYGYYYEITEQEAQRYRNTPQSRGYPRGQKRT